MRGLVCILAMAAWSGLAQFDYADQGFLVQAQARAVVGGGSVTPASFAGLMAWWDADTFAGNTVSGDTVGTWTNLYGGMQLTNANATYQPIWESNVVNGHAALKFERANYRNLFAHAPQHLVLTNFTMVFVGRWLADGCLLGTASEARWYQVRARYGGDNTFEAWRNNQYFRVYGEATNATNWAVVTFGNTSDDVPSDSWGMYNRGNLTGGGMTGRGGLSIVGNDWFEDRGHWPMEGNLAQILIYTNTLSTDDIVSLYTNYFKGRYSLP